MFDGPEDAERVDDPALGITPEHVLVLRGAGPVALGMPEAGSMPLPKHLAAQGGRGHGARLRRSHERHGVWNGGLARGPGSGRGRAAGTGPATAT